MTSIDDLVPGGTETVLITDATSETGFELAREFSRHGHPLVLLAREPMGLARAMERLQRELGLRALTLPLAADLLDPEAAGKVFSQLETGSVTVDILVNNAGCCHGGYFWEAAPERDIAMLHLNIEAAVRLTKLILPGMLARGAGRILNTVASTSGVEPRPAICRGADAFVAAWSDALAAELEPTGITVTACAGLLSPQAQAIAAYAATMQGARRLPQETTGWDLPPKYTAEAGLHPLAGQEIAANWTQ